MSDASLTERRRSGRIPLSLTVQTEPECISLVKAGSGFSPAKILDLSALDNEVLCGNSPSKKPLEALNGSPARKGGRALSPIEENIPPSGDSTMANSPDKPLMRSPQKHIKESPLRNRRYSGPVTPLYSQQGLSGVSPSSAATTESTPPITNNRLARTSSQSNLSPRSPLAIELGVLLVASALAPIIQQKDSPSAMQKNSPARSLEKSLLTSPSHNNNPTNTHIATAAVGDGQFPSSEDIVSKRMSLPSSSISPQHNLERRLSLPLTPPKVAILSSPHRTQRVMVHHSSPPTPSFHTPLSPAKTPHANSSVVKSPAASGSLVTKPSPTTTVPLATKSSGQKCSPSLTHTTPTRAHVGMMSPATRRALFGTSPSYMAPPMLAAPFEEAKSLEQDDSLAEVLIVRSLDEIPMESLSPWSLDVRGLGLTDRDFEEIKLAPDVSVMLTSVDVSSNMLLFMPSTFMLTSRMVSINLSDNCLTSCPDFSCMFNLRHIDLSRNCITLLHHSVFELPALETLKLSGNPLNPDIPSWVHSSESLGTGDLSSLRRSIRRLSREGIFESEVEPVHRYSSRLSDVSGSVSMSLRSSTTSVCSSTSSEGCMIETSACVSKIISDVPEKKLLPSTSSSTQADPLSIKIPCESTSARRSSAWSLDTAPTMESDIPYPISSRAEALPLEGHDMDIRSYMTSILDAVSVDGECDSSVQADMMNSNISDAVSVEGCESASTTTQANLNNGTVFDAVSVESGNSSCALADDDMVDIRASMNSILDAVSVQSEGGVSVAQEEEAASETPVNLTMESEVVVNLSPTQLCNVLFGTPTSRGSDVRNESLLSTKTADSSVANSPAKFVLAFAAPGTSVDGLFTRSCIITDEKSQPPTATTDLPEDNNEKSFTSALSNVANPPAKRNLEEALTAPVRLIDTVVPAPFGGRVSIVSVIGNGFDQQWRRDASTMEASVALLNEIMSSMAAKWRAYYFRADGSSVFFAFANMIDALRWCLAVQEALLIAEWPAALLTNPESAEVKLEGELVFRGLRLKMGVALGESYCHPSMISKRMEYFGPAVEDATRLGRLAHGGQVLLNSIAHSELQQLGESAILDVVIAPVNGARISQNSTVMVLPKSLARRRFPGSTCLVGSLGCTVSWPLWAWSIRLCTSKK